MQRIRRQLGLAVVFGGLALTAGPMTSALGGQSTQQPAPKHHSKVKGAIVGGVVGKMAGGHTKTGAVAGALVQHHRNKKARKR